MDTERAKCDICGELATVFARDKYRSVLPDGKYRFSPVPHVKCGCDEHPPESRVIELRVEDAENPVRALLIGEFDRAWTGWRA